MVARSVDTCLSELVDVAPGTFAMGSVDFYPDEAPVTDVSVEAFRIERHPVTNQQFRRFVEDTGHVTVAERPLDPADFPGADPESLLPGGLVFARTRGRCLERLDDLVALATGRALERTGRPGHRARRTRAAPGRARRV